jgi:hypothetical protein
MKPQATMPTPVLTDITPRLTKAATAVTSTRAAYQAAIDLRDELVVTAIDNGLTQHHVATAAGITRSTLNGILLKDGHHARTRGDR